MASFGGPVGKVFTNENSPNPVGKVFPTDAPPRPRPAPAPRPTAPAGAPATNAPPGPPGPAPGLPYDPTYNATLNANQFGYNNTIAGLNLQGSQLQQGYGFNAQGQFDPTNPFSKAALLKQAYQRGQARTSTSLGARGQLYAGSLQNALNLGTQAYNQNYGAARTSFENAMAKINAARASAEGRLTTENTSALGTALSNALATDAARTQTPVVNVGSGSQPKTKVPSRLKSPKPPRGGKNSKTFSGIG